jgi:hypothetical protein
MAAPISVIIPTLDSARHLPRALAPLVDGMQESLIREVIVSDGGSRDETLEIADAAGCTLISGEPGRAKQLLNGIARAKGKWLLILHPQTSLARGWTEEVGLFLQFNEARKRAATFKLAFDDKSAKTTLFWARLRAHVMKLPHGDQGLLVSRFLMTASTAIATLRTKTSISCAASAASVWCFSKLKRSRARTRIAALQGLPRASA